MQRIDDPEHRRLLVERRPRAVAMTFRDQLLGAVPELWALYEHWVHEGRNVNFMTGRVRGISFNQELGRRRGGLAVAGHAGHRRDQPAGLADY
jgi:hypothetical protein